MSESLGDVDDVVENGFGDIRVVNGNFWNGRRRFGLEGCIVGLIVWDSFDFDGRNWW